MPDVCAPVIEGGGEHVHEIFAPIEEDVRFTNEVVEPEQIVCGAGKVTVGDG